MITFNEVKVARKCKEIGVAHKVNFKTNPALKKISLTKNSDQVRPWPLL